MNLIYAGLALLAATLVWGFRRARTAYQRELEQRDHWPPESDGLDIPDRVNDGDTPLYQRFITAVDMALWESEMGQR